MKALALAATGLLLLSSLQPAFAWGGDGHRIVCAIAWDELTPAAKARVQSLLKIQTRDQFADLCLWADEWRDQGHRETSPWHSVGVPLGATSIDIDRDCKEPRSCVVAQLMRDETILRGDAPDDIKAVALKFLAHFVGDIHQPIHINHTGGRGGAFIRVTLNGEATDLHHIWDFDLIESTHKEWHDIAGGLERKITPKQRKAWDASAPIDWADESLTIANDPATEFRDHGDAVPALGEAYVRAEWPVAAGRLSGAGVRLANLLNGIFAGGAVRTSGGLKK